MTFVVAGSALGTLIHPIMLNNLFSRVGYGKTTLFSAALVTFMLLTACILIRPPLPTSTSMPPSIVKSICRFYKEWSFIMLSAGSLFYTIAYYFPYFFLQLDASKHGINKTLTFYLLVIMNASSLLGRLSPGFFAHSLGVVQMTVGSCICCSALIFSMATMATPPTLWSSRFYLATRREYM